MLNNKKLNPVVTESFITGRNLNIFLVFITKPYFTVPENIRLNYMHSVIMKIAKKKDNFNKLRLIINQILTFKTL